MVAKAQRAAEKLVEQLDSKLFFALAEPNRVQLVKVLLLHGPADVGTLAEHLPQDRSVISRHLKVMLEGGVVRCDRDGRRRVYQLDGARLIGALESMLDQCKKAVSACCG